MVKRKEIEEAMGGFSPHGAKIRRLDEILTPTIERVAFNASPMEQQPSINQICGNGGSPMIEFVDSRSSEDRAIVLYNPADTFQNFMPVQSNSSIIVSQDLVHCLKDQVFRQGNNRNLVDKSPIHNTSLAVVPWVPPLTVPTNWQISQKEQQNQAVVTEQDTMEYEEDISMEVETEPVETQETSIYGVNGGHGGFYQHCMVSEAPTNSTLPPLSCGLSDDVCKQIIRTR